MFLNAIAAIIAGRGRMQRPASRTVAAAVDKSNSMTTNARAERNTSAPTREEPNGHGIKLYGHDISDDSEGELVAVYSPAGGAMDGQIAYVRPRDFIDLEANR